jgi:hypothetical protein
VLEAFRKTLGLLAFARSTNGDSTESNIQLITYPIENGPHAELAAATVDKKEVKTSVYLFFSPDDLLAFVDIKDCWKDTDLALKLVQQGLIKQNSLPAEGCLIEYHVAPSFNESISTNHYDRRSDQLAQIFRKCVLLLSGESPPDGHSHHPLDKHKQRRFNDWKAWRLHITGSPIAIRLHYWRRGNEIILMQVGPHENMDINAPPEDLR